MPAGPAPSIVRATGRAAARPRGKTGWHRDASGGATRARAPAARGARATRARRSRVRGAGSSPATPLRPALHRPNARFVRRLDVAHDRPRLLPEREGLVGRDTRARKTDG